MFNLLLQVLDEGHLTDSMGHKIDFKNTILIMTSNIGIKDIKNMASYGFTNTKDENKFENMKNKLSDELKRTFNPEFLNRVDDIIFFKQLSLNEAVKIVDLAIKDVLKKLRERNIEFHLTDGAKKFIAEKGFDPLYGARQLKRSIQKNIEDPIADELLKGTFSDGSVIQVKLKNKNELSFIETERREVTAVN